MISPQAIKPKIKIVFLVSRFLDGGIDSVLIDYLNFLSVNSKYQITLLIEQKMDELEVFLSQIPDNVQVRHLIRNRVLMKWRKQKIVKRLPLPIKAYDEIFLSPIRRYIITKALRQVASQNDVIIDFDCCSYSLLENIKIKKIAWFHFSFEELMKLNRRRMIHIGKHLNSYDKIVAISNAMYEEGYLLFPELQNKLVVVYNAKKREKLLERAEEAIDDERINQPYIIAIERLEESQKDLTTLLYAYRQLRQQYGHTEKLFLLGKGQSEGKFQQQASALGLTEDVVFLGFRDNPYPWLKRARLLVHSAKFEGLPTILVEGLMLDKLIVATDCPTGPREILNGGKAGLLTPVGDVEAMAKAMHTLLTDRMLQTEILENVQQHRSHFMHEEVLQKFDNLINEVIDQVSLDKTPKSIVHNNVFDKIKGLWCALVRHTRKNNHLAYYIRGITKYITPGTIARKQLDDILMQYKRLPLEEQAYIVKRVDYYCRFCNNIYLPDDAPKLKEFTLGKRKSYLSKYVNSTYFFDAYEYVRFFPKHLRWVYKSGDVSSVLPVPAITKSRPITCNKENSNNILLNLDKVRHFVWVYDPFNWEEKETRILFRGAIDGKPRRMKFVETWKNHPLCNIEGGGNLSIYDHLYYKYIMALEGNDVASNLKWVMSSNSVAVMPRPTCETWYMEGLLIPNYHYIEIADDYHDLIDRIMYYEAHPEEVKSIVQHAHEWVAQFRNKKREKLVSLMVLDKYFRLTGQDYISSSSLSST